MTPTTLSPQVLVIGAGPVGLTLAIELRRKGIEVVVVDKVLPRPLSESRAPAVHSRTLEAWERSGIIDGMLARGRPFRGLSFFVDGRRIGRTTTIGLDAPYPFTLMIPQSVTEELLIERLAQLDVEVERPVELVDFSQDGQSVTAVLRRADGSTRQVTAEYMIGCDGGSSVVRKALGEDFHADRVRGAYIMNCTIDWRDGAPADDIVNFLAAGKDLIIIQEPEGVSRVIVSLLKGDPRMRDEKPTLQLMQELVDEYDGVGATLRDPVWSAAFFIRNRVVEQWRHGRVFLAGDAAHIHDPTGAQGMNTGVQDAINLGWKLAMKLEGLGNEDLLDSYESERRAAVRKLIDVVERTASLLLQKNPLLVRARAQVISCATALEPFQSIVRRAIVGFKVDYRSSPVVAERIRWREVEMAGPVLPARYAFRAAPVPGERAPDAPSLQAPGGATQRLYDLVRERPSHVVLLFAGLSPSASRLAELDHLAARLERYGAWVRAIVVAPPPHGAAGRRWQDSQFELHRRYGVRTEAAFVLRPDCVVGFRALPVSEEALADHLERTLGLRLEVDRQPESKPIHEGSTR